VGGLRRALRREDRELFDALFAAARYHTAACTCAGESFLRRDPDEHPHRGAPVGARTVETARGARTAADGGAAGMPRRELNGWVFDIAGEQGGMTVWFRTGTGETITLFAPFHPSFVLAGSA